MKLSNNVKAFLLGVVAFLALDAVYLGSTSSEEMLMTIFYPNFKPMGNSMAQKLKANNLKYRKFCNIIEILKSNKQLEKAFPQCIS